MAEETKLFAGGMYQGLRNTKAKYLVQMEKDDKLDDPRLKARTDQIQVEIDKHEPTE